MADQHQDNPPPPYAEATVPSPDPITRVPFFPSPPSSEAAHYINVIPGAPPIAFPFPEPSNLWLSRDVSHEDWAAFTANLVGVAGTQTDVAAPVDLKGQEPIRAGETQTTDYETHLARMREVLKSWNVAFFEPRGLRVVEGGTTENTKRAASPVSTRGSRSGSNSGKKWNFGPEKFGFQVGGALLGIDVSKPSIEKK
ncbi:hypothetical protein CI238_10870 [Colletotrichum incanum]|uniref:Uncharacterized protein n=1 Tax=Colletotrichum incanum TaxID=1573173 RepID=A0A162PJU5_COLIC|nr:hypothetical protein CI238_10870 [Colletotrichum incanum]